MKAPDPEIGMSNTSYPFIVGSIIYLAPFALKYLRRRFKSGRESIWLAELPSGESDGIALLKTLPEKAEIVIVGAGFSGVALSYHLSLLGAKCLCLDARQLCGSASGRNAGMLWPNESHTFELKTTEKLLDYIREHMGERGEEEALIKGGGSVRLLKKGVVDKGGAGVEIDIDAVLPQLNPSLEYTGIRDNAAVTFYPAKVVHSLAKRSQICGKADYMEYVDVLRIEKKGKCQHVITSIGTVDATKVVVCTNALIPILLPELREFVKPVSNTVLASRQIDAELLPNVSGISTGSGSAEVYLNFRRDNRIVLGGMRSLVESEETEAWEKAIKAEKGSNPIKDVGEGDPRIVSELKKWLTHTFPEISQAAEFEYSWKGLIAVTRDGMPLVGPLSSSHREGVFVCGGLGGHGMPRCYGLGSAMARMLLGVEEEEEYVKDYLRRCRVDRVILD